LYETRHNSSVSSVGGTSNEPPPTRRLDRFMKSAQMGAAMRPPNPSRAIVAG
jgi:hypothetical protein